MEVYVRCVCVSNSRAWVCFCVVVVSHVLWTSPTHTVRGSSDQRRRGGRSAALCAGRAGPVLPV